MSGHYVHVEISIASPGHTKIGQTVIMQYSPCHPSDGLHLQEIQAVAARVKDTLRKMDFHEPPDIILGGAAAHAEQSKAAGEIDTGQDDEPLVEDADREMGIDPGIEDCGCK